MEKLSLAIGKSMKCNQWHPIKFSKHGPCLSHLIFFYALGLEDSNSLKCYYVSCFG